MAIGAILGGLGATALGSVVGSAAKDIVSNITSGNWGTGTPDTKESNSAAEGSSRWNQFVDQLPDIAGGLITDLGSSAISNLWAKQNAKDANAQAVANNAQQYEWQKEAATVAWERSLHAMYKQQQVNQQLMNLDAALSEANAKRAWNRQQQQYATRYQVTMQDMARAGLNPILAASGGFNVGNGMQSPMGNVGLAGSSLPNVPMATPSLAQTFKSDTFPYSYSQSRKTLEESRRTSADVEKIRTSIKRDLQEIQESRARSGKLTMEEKVLGNQFWKTEYEIDKVKKEIALLGQELKLKQQSEEINEKIKQQYDAKLKELKQNIRKLLYTNSQLEKISSVYEGRLGSVLSYVSEISKSLGINIGALIP